jgi:hypothetical protein
VGLQLTTAPEFCVKPIWNTFIFISLAVTAMLLIACPAQQKIADLNRDPARYAGKEVTVAGRVTNSFGAFGVGAYQVDDGTGTMWVYTERYGTPASDAKVAVIGRIEQGFSFGGHNFLTVLKETQRRNAEPSAFSWR